MVWVHGGDSNHMYVHGGCGIGVINIIINIIYNI